MGTSCFSINCFVKKYCFIKPDQVDDFIDEPYHVYFIVSEHKAYYDKDSISLNNTGLSCKINKNERLIEIRSAIIPEFVEGLISQISFSLSNDSSTMTIHYFKDFVPMEPITVTANDAYNRSGLREFLECNVLYIGQSQGRINTSYAGKRLINHSTLRKIQSDIMASGCDDDLSIILTEFEINPILELLPEVKQEENYKKFINFWNHRHDFSHKLCIDVAEAGLINYFKPPYNKNYVSKVFSKDKESKFITLYQYNVDKVIIQFVPDKGHFSYLGDAVILKPDILLYSNTAEYDTAPGNQIIECNLNKEGALSTKLIVYNL